MKENKNQLESIPAETYALISEVIKFIDKQDAAAGKKETNQTDTK